jgi:nitroreductase
MRDVFEVLWQRHTCRAAFDLRKKIPEQDLQRILDAARWAPTAHNLQNFEIIVVDDEGSLAAISAIQLPPTETFITESYHRLSMPEAESLQRRTGLLAGMFPESWQEPGAARGDTAAAIHTYVGRTIQQCPMMLIVIHDGRLPSPAGDGDSLGLMSLGCVMQNLWLTGENLGISMQILTAFGNDAVENPVRSILAIPEHMKIAFAARLGYPKPGSDGSLRVRRRIQDFTHRNRYSVREPQP